MIRKVDKGRVSPDEGGPVSQMQKIALQRVNPDGSRHYLSAAGPIPGTPGVVAPPAPGMSTQAGTHPLLFQSPRVRDEMKDGLRIISDEVDDYLCWTIVGICKHSPIFFAVCANISIYFKQQNFSIHFSMLLAKTIIYPSYPLRLSLPCLLLPFIDLQITLLS